MIYDVIILGGGIAGLYASHQILKQNPKTKILVLEKENYLGGRIYTFRNKKMEVDAGAGRFNDKHTLLLKLIDELGLQKSMRPISADAVFIRSGQQGQVSNSVFDAPEDPIEENLILQRILNGDPKFLGSIQQPIVKVGLDLALGEKTQPAAEIIAKILLDSKLQSRDDLIQYSFIEYASKVVPPEEVQFIMDTFGYYSELVMMNAYDACVLMDTLSPTNQFYIMKGGMDILIKKLESKLSKYKNWKWMKSKTVENIAFLSQEQSDLLHKPKTQKRRRGIQNTRKNRKPSSSSTDVEVEGGNLWKDIMDIPRKIQKNPDFEVPMTSTQIMSSSLLPRRQNVHKIQCNDGTSYVGKICISTLPKNAMEQMKIFHPVAPLLNKIKCGALCRIYSKYEADPKTGKMWFEDLPKSTTDNKLRIIIPIDVKKGVIMVSYTDNVYAEYWRKIYEKEGVGEVEKKIRFWMEKTVGKPVPKPVETRVFYWKCGVGYWGIGANSSLISKRLTQPYASQELYICGESYSEKHQQWVEGSLETAQKVVDKIYGKSRFEGVFIGCGCGKNNANRNGYL